jgi:TAG lipase/steryl ester hydrolase/phospholipase A2/LPA acyltransferase
MLSGGAALGFYHTGVIKTLLQQKLFPRVVSGASAGSIMAALVSTRTDEELIQLLSTGDGTKSDFLEPAYAYSAAAQRWPWRWTKFLGPTMQGLL